MHFGQNVYQNLLRVLAQIGEDGDMQFAIFSGDLSQDHSKQSYRNFVQAVEESKINIPIYWLAGNHDSLRYMENLLTHRLICHDKDIEIQGLQLILLNSKSDTPAGFVRPTELERLAHVSKPTLVMMHHHAIPVNYFIDRHGLLNREEFWHAVNIQDKVIGVACGHIHRGITIAPGVQNKAPLYGCPATSIQFDPEFDGVKALPEGPAYRKFCFQNTQLTTEIKRLSFDGDRVS